VQESLHTILRGREIAASVIQEADGDFNITELLRELEGETARFCKSRIRALRAVARPNHGSEKRRRHQQDRAEKEAGEILPKRRTPPLARLIRRAVYSVIVAVSILRGRSMRPFGEITSM
jgi:hypothetical protein